MKKFLGISGLLIGLVLLFIGVTLLSRLTDFRSKVTQLKEEGFPVSIADLNKEGTKAGKETVRLLNRLSEPMIAFEVELWDAFPEEYTFSASQQMIEKFNELNDTYPTVFPLIEQISEQSGIETDFEGDAIEFSTAMMDQVNKFRSLARMLGWRMRVAAAEGRPDEALVDGVRILKLSQLAAQHPMLIAFITAEAVRGMGLGYTFDLVSAYSISEDARAMLNAELESQEARELFQTALETERAYGIASMIDTGTIQLAFGGTGYLKTFQQMIDRAGLEPFQREPLAEQSTSSILFNGVYGELVRPAISQAAGSHDRVRSQIRALRIISALQAATDIPDSITQENLMGLGVPRNMTIDRMSGQLMTIKKQDGKFNVYSVGSDRKDDGGSTKGQMDYGFDQ